MEFTFVPFWRIEKVIDKKDHGSLYRILLNPEHQLSDREIMDITSVLFDYLAPEKDRLQSVNRYFHLLGVNLRFGTEPKFNRQ
nr:hypothetical protein [Sicyoidochytrium minutum DNA virus]